MVRGRQEMEAEDRKQKKEHRERNTKE